VQELTDVASKLLALTDQGTQARATDETRIIANLQRLGGGPRPYFLAMRELKYSGPYVVPFALAKLQNPAEKELYPYIIKALTELGRPAVLPLERALATPNQKLQETIIGILGDIGAPYSLAPLKAIIENTKSSEGVKAAAIAALRKFADQAVLKTPAKVLYYDLAERYYYGKIVVADSRSPTTDIFDWVEGKGLVHKAAPSSVVGDILAARACSDCLKVDPGALECVSLWVAAMMQMEAKLGDKSAREADPFLPENMASVDFFARSVGQQHLYRVLDRSLRDHNTAVAARACEALQDVANESFLQLYGQGDVGSPLVMALTYPDQRVRFAAAFALANIKPKNAFTGAGKVVPVLSEGLNLEAVKSILLCEPEGDNRNRLASKLKELGWNVVQATSGNQCLSLARSMPRIDAIVLSSRTTNVSHADAVSHLRMDYTSALTPIIVISYPDDATKASWLEEKIPFLKADEPNVEPEALAADIEVLKKKAGSLVLEPEAARKVSLRAAQVLKDIAASSHVYSAERARQSLVDALAKQRPDELVIAVLNALSEIPDPGIEQAMAKVSVDAERAKAVRIAALQNLARAARTIGNKLQADDVTNLQKLAFEKDDQIRNADGEALGALDLDAAEGSGRRRGRGPRREDREAG
jgi:HEAT repeat protein